MKARTLFFAFVASCGTPQTSPTAQTSDTSAPLVDCHEVATEDCASTEGCWALEGTPLQDDGAGGWCVDYALDEHALGCAPLGTECGKKQTVGQAPEGERYLFPSTCLPDDFTHATVPTGPCP